MLVGITEPLEFTFLFISPLLFAVHAVLAASMSTVMIFGVVGNMGEGRIDQVFTQNWIPMFSNHADMMLTQIAIGLCFTLLYLSFPHPDLQFNMCTPGREDAEVKLDQKPNTKPREAKPPRQSQRAGSGCRYPASPGRGSAISPASTIARRVYVLHCMTCHKRWMTKSLKSWERTASSCSGDAIQAIIGLHVSQLREQLDSLINHQSAENVAITEAV